MQPFLSGIRTTGRATTFFRSDQAAYELAIERSFPLAVFRQPSKYKTPNHSTVATFSRLQLRRAQVRGTK